MRIGVVTCSYPRFRGDPAGCFVEELCDWLAARGHELEVIAAGPSPRVEASPYPVHRIDAGARLFSGGGAPEALRPGQGRGVLWDRARDAASFGWKLARILSARIERWDAMVAHWLVPCAALAAFASRRRDMPVWAIAHGGDVELIERLGLQGFVLGLLDRPQVHLNFVSNTARESFSQWPRELWARSSVHPMGIDLEHYRRLASQRTQGAMPRISFVGRLVPIKGADRLLRAVANLDTPCELRLAGDGPERARLQELAAQLKVKARFVGMLSTSERDQLLIDSDIVVVPSRGSDGQASRCEGMPRIVLEALACGAELVVSQSGGLAEIPSSIVHHIAASASNEAAFIAELSTTLGRLLGGHTAEFAAGHWLEERDWNRVAPAILRGLTHTQRG